MRPDCLKPKRRSALRLLAGTAYYRVCRRLQWRFGGFRFAKQQPDTELHYEYFRHSTPLLRQLRDVEMQLQYNKIENLRLAVPRLEKMLLHPGETLSYWRSIGNPTRRKGYREGMVLHCGSFRPGVGGGLCQLSNLIYWMTLHTPLTVVERYRHSYDVFPDSNRTQPFGSGATCVYNYRDLMIRNDTPHDFQLRLRVGRKDLEGSWMCAAQPIYRYEVYEKNHRIDAEYWGGYSRHNEIWRRVFNLDGEPVADEYVTENHALMMYPPFLRGQDLPE